MFEDYTVAVKVKLFNEVSGGLLLMSRQFEGLTEKAIIFQSHLKKIQGLMTASAGMLAGAGALAVPFVYAISKAAELQKQMIGIQVATHGTTAQMDSLRVAIEKASAPTVFSALDVAKMAKSVATSNSFNAPQLEALMPAIAKFADVQYLMKGTPYSSSVVDAVKMMHLAQKYSPKDVEPYFDQITKASFMMPGGVGELRSALSYFQPVGKSALGVNDKDSIMLVALLSRLGLSGSRGGTNLLAAMGRTLPGVFGSGLLKGKSHEALADMGFIDAKGHSKFMVNGKFDTEKWVQGLAAFVKSAIAKDPLHGRERVAIDLSHAFGVQGAKVASLLSSPGAIAQLVSMAYQFEQLAKMGIIQDQFVNQSASQQYQTAVTNFQNAMIELGYNLLPLATRALKDINAELNVFIPWMRTHKKEVKELSEAFLVLAGAMAFGSIVTGLTAAFVGLSAVLKGILAITGVSAATRAVVGGAASAAATAKTAVAGATVARFGMVGGAALLGYGAYKALGSLYDFLGFDKTKKIGDYVYKPGSFLNSFNPLSDNFTLERAQNNNQAQHQNSEQPVMITLNVDGRSLAQAIVPYQNQAMYHAQISGSNNLNLGMFPLAPNTGAPVR
jgi:hypothetical protein